MLFGSLFAGIGGFDLGLERAGMKSAWQVENDPFCTKVLTKHWPDVPKFGDIHDVGKHNLTPVDLICGGFPCQPFSTAGKQEGTKDDRHLWPEMLRVISELKPAWVVGENVPGIIPIFIDQAISDLEAEGYTCEAVVFPAGGFAAPHRRYRVFFVGYTSSCGRNWKPRRGAGEKPKNGHLQFEQRLVAHAFSRQSNLAELTREESVDVGRTGSSGFTSNPHSNNQETIGENGRMGGIVRQEKDTRSRWGQLTVEPTIRGMDDGVPNRVDRIGSLGNAVVPQVAEFIGELIMEVAENIN